MNRLTVVAVLSLARIDLCAGWACPTVSAVAGRVPSITSRPFVSSAQPSLGQVARPCAGGATLAKAPAPELGTGYTLMGYATLAAWAACVVITCGKLVNLSKQPVSALTLLLLVQPLTPLPLVASVFLALSRSAGKEGWWAMNRLTYRRLNLGVAVASLWLAFIAFFGPPLSNGYRVFSHTFANLVTAAHLGTALFCLWVWLQATGSSQGNPLVRLARGVVGSLWALVPQTKETGTISKSGSASHLDDPESQAGADGRNEYSIACILFLWFTVMPNIVDISLATVPSVLGKRLTSAASAWTLLAAVAAYVLKDATQRGRIHSGTTFRYLRYGFIASSGLHLLLVAVEVIATGGVRHLRADIASVVMHALVLLAALTPPPKKPKTGSTTVVAPPAAVPAAPPPAPTPPPPAPAPAAPVAAAAPAPPPPAPAPAPPPPAAAPAAPPVPAAAAGQLVIGQKVQWQGKSGIVRFVGPVKFAPGEWIGVELDSHAGMHNGTVLGVQYFDCKRGYGIFSQAAQLKPMA